MDTPIPALYACYLLRSTVRHASLYVGSTPHPVRRLRQHNGESKGGAARTSRDSLRPWEMACLVTGFPSKIAALQFEWAWQNTHLTRHVSADSRLAHAQAATRISPRTGRVRKRPARPRLCLTDRLANLHLLLRAPSFARWPLDVTFYAPDVYRVWTKWTSQHATALRPGIAVALDDALVPAAGDPASSPPQPARGIRGLDVGYSTLKPHLRKSQRLLENAEWWHCSVCQDPLPTSGAMTLVCPQDGCSTRAHIECLSATFLQSEPDAETLVPTSGACPGCGTPLRWVDLVRELSLRMRGEREVAALFATKRRRRTRDGPAPASRAGSDLSADEDEPDAPVPGEDGWLELPDSSEDEVVAEPLVRRRPRPAGRTAAATRRTPEAPRAVPMVEDSEWDEAQVLT